MSEEATLAAELSAGKPATARIEHVENIPFGPATIVERWRLGNGLTVLVSIDRTAPIFSYHTWFSVGSRHEKKGKTGLAHLFEHLMFNETESLPAGVFDQKLEESGAESNAATWVDWTYYHESLPSEAQDLAVDLEGERMSRLVLRDPQVSSEKEVVANERRMRVDDDVDGAVSELLYATAFEQHGYGWPTIGWMDDIQGFTTDDCNAFYRTYYAPNNATVVVVGDIDRRRLLERVQTAYGALSSAEIPVEDVRPEPPQVVERRVEIEKPTPTEKVVIGYKGPALGDPDHAGLSLLSEVLFGGRASRLHRVLVQDTELALEARGWVSTFRDPGLFDVSVVAREGVTAEQVLEVLDRELDRVIAEPPTAAEIARVKARLELGSLQSMETAAGKAEQIGFWELLSGDPAGAFVRLAALRRVTASDLLRAARRFLRREGRTVIFVRVDESDEEEEEEEEEEGEDA
jgi:zinc protease